MKHEVIQRVRIYMNEHDQFQDQPLHLVILERLQREGATSAMAFRGMVGFGPGQRLLATGFGMNEHVPLVIEWIDRAERVARIMPLLEDILGNTTVTVEDVQVYHAILHAKGPFDNERSVGDVMRSAVQALPPDSSLQQAIQVMIEHKQETLPVVGQQQSILGVITDQELAVRASLSLPLRLLRLLTDAERQTLIDTEHVNGHLVDDVMFREPRSVYIGSELPRALTTMIEWNYRQIPVTSHSGSLTGLLDFDAVLQSVVDGVPEDSKIRNAEPPTPVQLVMQHSVPHIGVMHPLRDALRRLIATPNHYLVIVDADGHVQGSLSDEDVLQCLSGDERAVWLAGLQKLPSGELPENPGGMHRVGEIMQRNIPCLAPNDSLIDATRCLLEHRLERAPVVSDEGKLLGLLARSGLVRALVQEGH
jgi:CBS-domain-containing membrane protein/PII-like signaling protein